MAGAHGGVREAFSSLYHCRLILGRVGETEVPLGSDHRSPFSVQSSQSIPTVSGLCRDDGPRLPCPLLGVKRTSRLVSGHAVLHRTCPLLTQSGLILDANYSSLTQVGSGALFNRSGSPLTR